MYSDNNNIKINIMATRERSEAAQEQINEVELQLKNAKEYGNEYEINLYTERLELLKA